MNFRFLSFVSLTATMKWRAAWTADTHDPLRTTSLGLVIKSMLLFIRMVWSLTFQSFYVADVTFSSALQSLIVIPLWLLPGYLYFFRGNLRYEYSYTHRKVSRIMRTNSIFNC